METAFFLTQLEACGRKRLRLEEVGAIFDRCYREFAGRQDRNRHLLLALKALNGKGISLPDQGWTGDPPLPRTVLIGAPETRAAPRAFRSRPAVVWHPRLQEAAAEARSGASIATLMAINDYLLRWGGRVEVSVPTAERSLEIFGNEKRLDALVRGRSLPFNGFLDLSDLHAYQPDPFLSYEPAPAPGRPVVVLENQASFESFRVWNRRSRAFSAVCWGAGRMFMRSWVNLPRIAQAYGARDILYLGDLDPEGMEIAGVLSHISQMGLDARCMVSGYRWLVEHGVRRPHPAKPTAGAERGLLHLPEDLAGAIRSVWNGGEVIPQESLGLRILTSSAFSLADRVEHRSPR